MTTVLFIHVQAVPLAMSVAWLTAHQWSVYQTKLTAMGRLNAPPLWTRAFATQVLTLPLANFITIIIMIWFILGTVSPTTGKVLCCHQDHAVYSVFYYRTYTSPSHQTW